MRVPVGLVACKCVLLDAVGEAVLEATEFREGCASFLDQSAERRITLRTVGDVICLQEHGRVRLCDSGVGGVVRAAGNGVIRSGERPA